MQVVGPARSGGSVGRAALRAAGRAMVVLVLLPVAALSVGATSATAADTGLIRAVTLVGPLSQDVTVGAAEVTFTVQYAPVPAGAQSSLVPLGEAVFTPAPGAPTEGLANGIGGYRANSYLGFSLLSGTPATGSTWRGSFTPLAGAKGTYRLALGDGTTSLDPAQVEAAFGPRAVTVTTTALPVKPTSVKVQKNTSFSSSQLGWYTTRNITWARPAAGSPAVTGVRVVSASSGCGYLARWDLNGTDGAPYIYWVARAGLFNTCKIVFQLVNGAGPTASVTVNA